MNDKKFSDLKDRIEEFIAEHEMKNHHYLRDSEIISAFSYAKKKHVKKAIEELR